MERNIGELIGKQRKHSQVIVTKSTGVVLIEMTRYKGAFKR